MQYLITTKDNPPFLTKWFDAENTDKRSLIFSERNGYIKTIKIGNYSIKFLNK